MFTINLNKAGRSKSTVQYLIQSWLADNLYNKPTVLTLSGGDPLNAIQSVALISDNINLYEYHQMTYAIALAKLDKTIKHIKWPEKGQWSPNVFEFDNKKISINFSNIFNHLHHDCNCLYYDICKTYKSLDFDNIETEILLQTIMHPQQNEVSIVFTVALRGKGYSGKETHNKLSNFINRISRRLTSYNVIKMSEPIHYRGGINSNGTQMYNWAVIFRKKNFIKSKTIKDNNPDLFNKPILINKVKKDIKIKPIIKSNDISAAKKEMINTLLDSKSNKFTKEQIYKIIN